MVPLAVMFVQLVEHCMSTTTEPSVPEEVPVMLMSVRMVGEYVGAAGVLGGNSQWTSEMLSLLGY